jgi:hypothetical protein
MRYEIYGQPLSPPEKNRLKENKKNREGKYGIAT